jgi:hypothetical protein
MKMMMEIEQDKTISCKFVYLGRFGCEDGSPFGQVTGYPRKDIS